MPQPIESYQDWEACLAIVRPALLLAPSTYLHDVRSRLKDDGILAAVAHHDTAALFAWIIRLLDRQGISNAAAISFTDRHGGARWDEIDRLLARRPPCPKLTSHWHFADCGYRKEGETCVRPYLLPHCPLPRVPARKGALSRAAFGLALFLRDVCGRDLVGWIDARLAAADPGLDVRDRAIVMRSAVLDPLVNVAGTGVKTWSMILAELLLGADAKRERWITTGASFVAIDSLIHNFLHRTGVLRRLDAEHRYGPACYAPGGCAEVIAALAERVDAREFDPAFPHVFPRWVQFALWLFCAADGLAVCSGNTIDDRVGCRQRFCPCSPLCDKIVIKPI